MGLGQEFSISSQAHYTYECHMNESSHTLMHSLIYHGRLSATQSQRLPSIYAMEATHVIWWSGHDVCISVSDWSV